MSLHDKVPAVELDCRRIVVLLCSLKLAAMTILRASSVLSLSVFNSCLITQRSFSTTSEMVKKVKFAQLMAGASLFFKHPARIIQSNDDGWAESYIRVLNNALIEAGHDVVLSAPAENMSGTSK